MIKLLQKVRYFGVRFIYYCIKRKIFSIKLRVKDFFYPTLTSRFLTSRIIKQYGGLIGHAADEKSYSLGLGYIHYGLIRILKPKNILCIGSYRGYIPLVCALACNDNNFGSVDFVDAGSDFGKKYKLFGDGFWKRVNTTKYFEKMVSAKRIKIYVMKSEMFAHKYPARKYGYIYVDGDHSYKGVKSDYRLFWRRLLNGGFMTFHDILGSRLGKKEIEVSKLWEEIPNKHKINIDYPLRSGLGILQKK